MDLLIIGAGGHGQNCLEIARAMGGFDRIAFLDEKLAGSVVHSCEVLGGMEDLRRHREQFQAVFVAIGNNEVRQRLMKQALNAGFELPTLVSPMARVSLYGSVGSGSVIFPFVSVEHSAEVGMGVVLATGVTVGHNARVDDGCLIYENSVIRPYSSVGPGTRIGAGCVVEMKAVILQGSVIEAGTVVK